MIYMNPRTININDINESDYNPRYITTNDYKKLKNSISKWGLVEPILINLQNNTIIGGHQRYKAFKELNPDENTNLTLIPINKYLGWCFLEKDLENFTDKDEKGLNIALNKISGLWDFKKLSKTLAELSLDNFDLDLTGFDDIEIKNLDIKLERKEKEKEKKEKENSQKTDNIEDNIDYSTNEDDKYRASNIFNTKRDSNYSFDNYELKSEREPDYCGTTYGLDTKSPIYEIKGKKPSIDELYDYSKTKSLIDEINNTNIDDKTKEFLIEAAKRHTVFYYDKIAEFYAHQNKEVQELMENSALVIIDLNKAIEQGFVKNSLFIQQLKERNDV